MSLSVNAAVGDDVALDLRFSWHCDEVLELCLNLGDGVNQAANLASSTTSVPSRNLVPLTTFGNWF